MRKATTLLVLAAVSLGGTLSAHPMGNFSVNHYSRLDFKASGLELTYVLDLAEIPTFQLGWNVDWKDSAGVAAQATQQAQEWMKNVSVTQAGQPLALRIRSITPASSEGAGGMPVLRTSIVAEAVLQPGKSSTRITISKAALGGKRSSSIRMGLPARI